MRIPGAKGCTVMAVLAVVGACLGAVPGGDLPIAVVKPVDGCSGELFLMPVAGRRCEQVTIAFVEKNTPAGDARLVHTAGRSAGSGDGRR